MIQSPASPCGVGVVGGVFRFWQLLHRLAGLDRW
jgi:hypothetical protein